MWSRTIWRLPFVMVLPRQHFKKKKKAWSSEFKHQSLTLSRGIVKLPDAAVRSWARMAGEWGFGEVHLMAVIQTLAEKKRLRIRIFGTWSNAKTRWVRIIESGEWKKKRKMRWSLFPGYPLMFSQASPEVWQEGISVAFFYFLNTIYFWLLIFLIKCVSQ